MTRCEWRIFGGHKWAKWADPELMPADAALSFPIGNGFRHVQKRGCERCGYVGWRKLP